MYMYATHTEIAVSGASDMSDMEGIVDIASAVRSGVFGTNSIARLNEAINKMKSATGQALRFSNAPLTTISVCVACVNQSNEYNAHFFVFKRGGLLFKRLEPKCEWSASAFIKLTTIVTLCDHCLTPHDSKRTTMKCAACRVHRYCNKTCQKNAWPSHKEWCSACSQLNKEMSMIFTNKIHKLRCGKAALKLALAMQLASLEQQLASIEH